MAMVLIEVGGTASARIVLRKAAPGGRVRVASGSASWAGPIVAVAISASGVILTPRL